MTNTLVDLIDGWLDNPYAILSLRAAFTINITS